MRGAGTRKARLRRTSWLLLFVLALVVGAWPASAATPAIGGAAASSVTGAFAAANAVDGNGSTFYSSAGYSDPNHSEWLRVDLGSTLGALNGVVLTPRQNGYGFPSDFSIQASNDGSTWRNVPGGSYRNYSNPGSQPVTVTFQDFVSARYLRVYATKLGEDNVGMYYLQLMEFSVKQKFIGASASSVIGSFAASNVFDGDYTTFYSSASHAGAAATEWVSVDLGSTVSGLNTVQLAPRQNGYGFPAVYKIQTSTDGSTWTDAPGASFSGAAASPGSKRVIRFDSDVSARYVRLYATQLSADNGGTYYLQLMEMNVGRTETQTPQTPSGAGASSAISGWPAASAIDGNAGSAWSSANHVSAAAGESFTLTYGASYAFSQLKLTPRGGGLAFPVDFKLQYSTDGSTFVDIPGQSYTSYPNPGSKPQTFSFDPVQAKALRIAATKLGPDDFGNYYFQLAEAAAYPWDVYADTWTATDDLGRNVSTYGQTAAPRAGKTVGMFYFAWLQDWSQPVYDTSQILAANPTALSTAASPPWGAYGKWHTWGESALGHYQGNDAFVLRKHAQELSDAGVDTIVYDLSNFNPGDLYGSYYKTNWMALLDVWGQVRAEGGKTPQVAFLCPFGGGNVAPCVNQLYTDLYGANVHPDLWFQWGGKPLILADPSAITIPAQSSFFTFRKPQPDYFAGPTGGNQWSWLEVYPQHGFYTSASPGTSEQASVGVAQNAVPNGSGGWQLGAMSQLNGSGQLVARGRSFHNGSSLLSTNPNDPAYKTDYGLNFGEQWGRAIDIDPSFVWVTGWNEWIALRFNSFAGYSGNTVLVDQFNREFSRDIEPMNGGHKDNYYNQLVDYVRKFKGARQQPPAGPAKTIAVDGSFADWADVTTEYRDNIGDTAHRSHPGFDPATTYADTSGRNDIQSVKVARDDTNVYFYVRTQANLTAYSDAGWMRLFIRTNGSSPNWEGYNFVVNRGGLTSTTTKLETSTGGWNWGSATTIQYRASGREMELAIPRSALGFTDAFAPLRFDFKVADNITDGQDSLEFYKHGDAAPNERFRYTFDEFTVQ
ncbi:discoidin domain-containing protein [Paenibacillus sacheonensis]|uniref:F5/8 type C domain-containing protein n=1 Tax=Paenibacillus sacheonensis TaxID=742054 RepID=A0A7X5BZQ4_9BACL|nr:discoidin domain-containing protein [Paenibacillus sacheonensis]MBM7568068.1 hypothetical protein [Paenibacillus sacheonensis]NBC72903.1 hypothetical protein [Paenibacillus sacheonensis]